MHYSPTTTQSWLREEKNGGSPHPGSRKSAGDFVFQQKRVSVPTQAVKPFRVAIAHRVFVCFGEPAVFVELFELRLAGFVVDLVRKVRREDERLIADDAHCEGQRQLVAFNADENSILIHMAPNIVCDGLLVAQLQKAPARIVLYVAAPGALEALDAVDEPTRSGLHEAEANFWICVEDAPKKKTGEVDHLPKRVPQRIDGRIGAHVIQTHMVMHPAVNADAALQTIGLFIDWPVAIVTQLILLSYGARARQHRTAEAELFDDAA